MRGTTRRSSINTNVDRFAAQGTRHRAGHYAERARTASAYASPVRRCDCVYTDGVTDALDRSEEEFGMSRLTEAVQEHAAKTAQELINEILRAVEDFEQWRAPV